MDSGKSTQESPVLRKIRRKRKANVLTQESPLVRSESLAEYFAKNKNIAGFDNLEKALYNTVRGLVENALDSAESVRTSLPLVEITIEEIKELTDTMIVHEGSSFYRVTCKDNGRGMDKNDILKLIGRVVYRNEREVKQTRGMSALGVKMALIWSKISTRVPVKISTSLENQNHTSNISLDIDISNRNNHEDKLSTMKVEDDREEMTWHGAEIKVEIEGKYGAEIMDSKDKHFRRTSRRRPAVALETKVRPLAKDMKLLQDRLADDASSNVLKFLQCEFPAIGEAQATKIIGKIVGGGEIINFQTKLNSLTLEHICRIQKLLAKIDCRLIPVGEEKLRLYIINKLKPESVATYTASSFHGHRDPYIVEAAVSLGGKGVMQDYNIYLFANRAPLLFEKDADVVTKIAMNDINWKRYKINPQKHKVGVYVSIVSTRIPFKKETGMSLFVNEKIACAVKTCLEECCMQLESEITKDIETAADSMHSLLTRMSKLYPSKNRLVIQNWEDKPEKCVRKPQIGS